MKEKEKIKIRDSEIVLRYIESKKKKRKIGDSEIGFFRKREREFSLVKGRKGGEDGGDQKTKPTERGRRKEIHRPAFFLEVSPSL